MAKRIMSLLLAVVFLAGSYSIVVRADESVSDDVAAFSYISISADEIQRTLSTLTLPRTARSLTLIEIRDVRLNGDFIEVIGNFEARNFHLRGTMFASGLDEYIYVAVMEDTQNVLDVLYFEISTRNNSRTLFNEAINHSPLFKLYALSSNGDLIVIEQSLSEIDVDVSSLDRLTPDIAPGINDALWFTGIIEPTESFVIPSEGVMSMVKNDGSARGFTEFDDIIEELRVLRATNTYLWAGNLYIVNFNIGSDLFSARATPSFDGSIVDINSRGGTSNWTSSLRVVGSVTMNGQIVNLQNIFQIMNARVNIVADNNTVFTSATADGRYIRPTGGSVQISVAGLLSSLPGATGTVATILSSISATRPGTNLVQGSNLGLAPNTRAFGFTFDRSKLDSPDHHLSLNAFASFALGGTGNRQAGVNWSFDFFENLVLRRSYSQPTTNRFVSYRIN